MFDIALAAELDVIGLEFAALLQLEQLQAAELDLRFAEDRSAIENLLQSIQVARTAGQWRKTQFNLFEVLGRPRLEVAHSRFVAWLLNPVESHGIGGAFLRQFMLKGVKREPPSIIDLTVSPELQFSGGRFDIHIKGDRWCLIVENKIDAILSTDQCKKYQAYCDGLKARGQEAWLVYVTQHVRPPSGDWISYRDIRQILERILASSTPPPPARIVIEQFCEHVFADLEDHA
jgi:hypothetical protein